VESPTKARKIGQILGDAYVVEASYGHVRQLPRRGTAVEPDSAFRMTWEVSRPDQLQLLESRLADASGLVLATDPDREGEAISWHLLQHFKVCCRVLSACWCCVLS
jgi:DNA topoisomerase-1